MYKRLVLVLSLLFALTNFVACTSSDSYEDSEVAEVEESEEGAESLDVVEGEEGEAGAVEESLDGGETLEVAEGEASEEPQVSEDTLPEEALADSELSLDEEIAASEASTGEEGINADAVASVDDSSSTDAPPTDTFAEAPPMEISEPTSEVATSTVEEKPTFSAPLQKVPTMPWRQGGVLYNSVYFAKPDQNLRSISTEIYGDESRASELRKGNGIFASRGVLPGDKVYYNSPTRPTDDTRVLSFYEEKGLTPQTYVAQDGDTLKEVSKKLLGYSAGWKELWASNSFESRGELAAGTEVRYYQSNQASMAPPVLADASTNQYTPPPPSMPEPMPEPELPPPPPPSAMNDMQPPPSANAMNEMPPPPPPEQQMEQIPPPPPPPPPVAMNNDMGQRGANDMGFESEAPFYEDPTIALGLAAGALVLLGVIVMASRRRKHQRELEQALAQHNVG